MTDDVDAELRYQLGAMLHQCRERANLSIMHMKERYGIPVRVLDGLETGQLQPDSQLVDNLATIYDLSPEERHKVQELAADLENVLGPEGRELLNASRRDTANPSQLIFLCHSKGDMERVRKLYHRLRLDGFNCWFDEENLLAGQDWDYEISRAIRKSKFVLACLSIASITKTGYVQKELKRALDVADEQPEGVAYLIPVKLEECEVPSRLSQWQWVNLFDHNGYRRLIRGLRAGLAEPNASS